MTDWLVFFIALVVLVTLLSFEIRGYIRDKRKPDAIDWADLVRQVGTLLLVAIVGLAALLYWILNK